MSKEELDHEIQEELREQLNITPSPGHAYVCIGYRAMIDLNEEKAVLAFQKAANREPDLASPHQFLGLIYADRGENERAVEHFGRCIGLGCKGLDPAITEENPYYHMGWCFESLNQFQASEKSLTQGIKAVPSHYETYLRLGRVYHQQGKYEAAVAVYGTALEAISSHSAKSLGDPVLGVTEGANTIRKLARQAEERLLRTIKVNLGRARSRHSYQEVPKPDL